MRKNWEIKSLKEVGEIYSGNSINAKVKKDKYTNIGSGMPYVATKDVSYASEINYNNGIRIPFDEIKKFRIAKKNSVLICSEGGSAGRKFGILKEDVCFVNKLISLNPNNILISKFLFYWYSSNQFQRDFKDKLTGLIGGITKTNFKNLSIPIPTIEDEQKRIIKKLDESFEKIDKAIENTKKNIENTKELFQSKLNEVFCQKDIEWKEKRIIDFCKNKSQIVGGPFGSNLKVKDYKEKGVPILRLQNIGKGYFIDKAIKYISHQKADELSYHSFQSGDIVLAKLGIPIGKTCIVPENFKYGIVVADVVRIRPNKNEINYDFLKYFLNSDFSVNQLTADIKGATRPRVNISEVRNLKLSVPKILKQEETVKYLDKLSDYTKKLESTYNQKLLDLEELKKSILDKAFKGEL